MVRVPDLPIPAAALGDCGAILGRRGAGKSGTGRIILEHELDAGHRCCVLDPKGDWYGIRANRDGKPSRFRVPVFGGAHADQPIDDGMGKTLGTMVATTSTSCVIDLSGFSRAGMLRFMTAFAEALFTHNRQPLTLLVDEADQLAPQRVPAEIAKLLHWMEALIRQGRQRGIFMWMLTQRPAVINKNLLSQAETLIAMKMTGPQDRAAIRDWMEAHDPAKAKEVEQGLASLRVGEAYAWVPGEDFLERVRFPLYETFDSGRTPRHGEIVAGVTLAPLDLSAIAEQLQLGEKPDEAAELREQLAAARATIAALGREVDAAERRADEAGQEADRLLAVYTDIQDRMGAAFGSARIEPLPKGAAYEDYLMIEDRDGVVRPFPRAGDPSVRVGAARRRIEKVSAPPTDEDLREAVAAAADATPALAHLVPAQRRIVAAAAIGGGELMTIERVADLAGVKSGSSNLDATRLRRLADEGLLRVDGRMIGATPRSLPQAAAQPATIQKKGRTTR